MGIYLELNGNLLGIEWGFNGDLMGFNGDLMGFNGDLIGIEWGFNGIYIYTHIYIIGIYNYRGPLRRSNVFSMKNIDT